MLTFFFFFFFFGLAKRRNKWICALKTALAEVKICGPNGDPNAPPVVSRYTKVPWSIIHADDQHTGEKETDPDVDRSRTSWWKLGDEKKAAIRTFFSLQRFFFFVRRINSRLDQFLQLDSAG